MDNGMPPLKPGDPDTVDVAVDSGLWVFLSRAVVGEGDKRGAIMLHSILLAVFFRPLPGDADTPRLMVGPGGVAAGTRHVGLQVQDAPVPGRIVGNDPDAMLARREGDLP